MEARLTILAAWSALFAAPIVLAIGHLGASNLSWSRNHISTYAALAPNGGWIIAGTLLSAFTLLCLGVLISFWRTTGQKLPSRIASMAFGIAASGLLILSGFREAAMNMRQLKVSGFEAIRQQSFHEAGLLLFFNGAVMALFISGLMAALQIPGWGNRMSGLAIAATGPAACAAIFTAWPVYAGFSGDADGLKQRCAFLCLWFGALILLALLTKSEVKRDGP